MTNHGRNPTSPPGSPPRLRVCAVSFLNAWPLVEPLTDGDADAPADPVANPQALFDVETALPSECARRLAEGTCDIALVPVASCVGHPDWEIVPEIGIGCEGRVETVILVTAPGTPLAAIERVHLDAASRSSAAMTRVLMHGRGFTPRYTIAPHGEGLERLRRPGRERDASLIIGDAAFGLCYGPDRIRNQHGFLVRDLGAMWQYETGLPFVFAVWAARSRDVLTPAHTAALHAARDRGRTRVAAYARRYCESLARTAAPPTVLTAGDYERYLRRTIRYDLTPLARAGMREFLARLSDLPADANADANSVLENADADADADAGGPRDRGDSGHASTPHAR